MAYLYLSLSRNRLSPRYINIATTRDNCWGHSTSKPKRNTRRKKRESNANSVGSTKNEDDPQPLRPPENSHHALSTRCTVHQATPSRRGATTTTLLPGLVLGFPPVHRGARGRGTPGALQEGRRRPRASPRRCRPKPTRISPDPQKPAPDAPSCSPKAHRPPTRATTVLQPSTLSHRGHGNETSGIEKDTPGARNSKVAATREGTASTANGSSRPDTVTGANQAHLARPSPWRAREAPVVVLQQARHQPSHPPLRPPLRPPEAAQMRTDPARPDPDGARRAQIWARRAPPRSTAPPRSQVAEHSSPHHPSQRRPGRRAAAGSAIDLGAPPPDEETPRHPSKRAGKSSSAAAGTARGSARRPAPTAAAGRGRRGGAAALGLCRPPCRPRGATEAGREGLVRL